MITLNPHLINCWSNSLLPFPIFDYIESRISQNVEYILFGYFTFVIGCENIFLKKFILVRSCKKDAINSN